MESFTHDRPQQTPDLNARWANPPSSISNQSRISSNQNINVEVNVASGANHQEIGSEVSKALRQALERERLNAFMGVAQYAVSLVLLSLVVSITWKYRVRISTLISCFII